MKRPQWKNIVLVPGSHVPSVPLAFITVTAVMVLQMLWKKFVPNAPQWFDMMVTEVVVVAGLPLMIIAWRKFQWQMLLPFRRISLRIIFLVVMLTIVTDALIEYLIPLSEQWIAPPETYHEYLKTLLTTNGTMHFASQLLLLCLLPGICEEILFRGYLQTALAFHWGSKRAFLLTAFIFALAHPIPWYFHFYFALGLLFSWTYAVTGTLWLPILAHVTNNAWTLLMHDWKIFPSWSLFPFGIVFISICCMAIFFLARAIRTSIVDP